MNIAHIEEISYIYGPGTRFVIWVQGCSIRCKGCWNREMWSFEKRSEYTIEELLNMIRFQGNAIEGITILGGEPLDQFCEVHALCLECQHIGLSTMVFTGYELFEIDNSEKSKIKSVTDILIVGRYDESKRTLYNQWIGSTNQQVLFLTKRYNNNIKNKNYVEVNIDENGALTLLGFPTKELRACLTGTQRSTL